jgi:hypothetical protein
MRRMMGLLYPLIYPFAIEQLYSKEGINVTLARFPTWIIVGITLRFFLKGYALLPVRESPSSPRQS